MIDLERVRERARKQEARAAFHARHPKARRYWRDASDRDELGPELVAAPAPRRPCIGCGRVTVRGRHYCHRCRGRLRAGLPVDLDEYPTTLELVAAGILSGGGR